ncbi:MAG: hypothetical protein KF740_10485 [Ramlibacter sp.]|nr:hypothetical protein [Ramlibacter sp.]
MATPKDQLLGKTIGSGWVVTEMLQRAAGQTGGNFSTGYIASKGEQRAFLKAMDLTRALLEEPDQQFAALRLVIDMIQFEGSVLEACTSHKLSRVVQLLETATVDLPTDDVNPIVRATNRVHAFIFELGGPDVRKAFGVPSASDTADRLLVLHHLAVAVQQLHSIGITHQDIKPSNVLGFREQHKLTDLGRASRIGFTSPLDGELFPGDPTYCPPEFAYGHTPADYVDRRQATDAYMLGSMIAFLFTLQGTTTLLQQSLQDHVLPPRWRRSAIVAPWTGGFDEALPYLIQATTRVRSYVESHIPAFCRTELGEAFANLSHPSPYERGHPRSRRGVGRQVGIDRYVSLFDLLSRRARVQAKAGSVVSP